MLDLKRWIAAVLAACTFLNAIPVYAFAEEMIADTTITMEAATEEAESSSEEQETVPDPALVEVDTPEEPGDSDPAQKVQEEPTTQETENTDPAREGENPTTQESESLGLDATTPPETESRETQEDNEVQITAEEEIADSFALRFLNAIIYDEEHPNGVELGEKYPNAITQNGNVITLTIGAGQGEILALLSQQTQTAESNYQNWNIDFNFTGELSLPDTFQGLGDWGETADTQFPFKGKFTNQTITITTSKTLFKALDASADLHGNKITWAIVKNAATPTTPILTKVLVADSNEYTINMPLASANRFNPYIGQLTGGTGEVILPALDYSNVGDSPAVDYPDDVGLVCCSMDAGTSLQIGAVTLPSRSLNLKSSSGNVGSLVGSMGAGAKLTIIEDLTLNATLNGTNAGGLVGSMTNATIEGTEGKTINVTATLTATQNAGGIAGVVTTATGPLGTNANVTLNTVKANGTQNSGVLYGTCTATGNFNPLTGVSFGATREVSGPGNCGGLFGTLTLNESGKCTITAPEGPPLEIFSSLADATNATAYGGVAGNLTGGRANALVVENCTITSNVAVGINTANYPQYLGGIVAKQVAVEQKAATLDAKASTITVNSPTTKNGTDYGFGGVTAYLDDGALLIADGMKIVTDSYATNPGGGGVVGSAHKGSIVYLKTSLDLSECQLSTNATSGQIVGSQDCSLIYAPGVAITRLKTGEYSGMELDDIGNYGELYRLAGFLTINPETYVQTLPSISSYTLSTQNDYACLALAWQSRGYFPTVNGITSGTWSNLKSSTITLGDNIDLTGCGIGGLTRDAYAADDTFTGTFDGGGYTLTLDIGKENQANETKVSKGDGRIYWHNATGLFAAISSSATVQGLTLAGSIRVSNNKLAANAPMYCGGLAARLSCDTVKTLLLDNVNTEVEIFADNHGNYPLYIGGLFGQIYGKATVTINLNNLAAEITLNNSNNGSYNHTGGAVGYIDKDSNVTIVCNGTTLAGKIQYNNAASNIYAGGLVGTIFPGGSGKRTITLTNLTVNGFTLSGKASDRMGGILGGIWADTDVTVGGLTVTGTTLTANGAAALGGLVYRASGKWTVSSVDLSGLTITASSASALGVLVCQGGPYKDTINGSYQNVDGLYLEMAEHWNWNAETKKGYCVPSSITFNDSVFDEFVAYTAWADRTDDTPNYQITANGSGIISLRTEGENPTVKMTGDAKDRNTYFNRTAYKQDNPHSRYYYNLPKVKAACNRGNIDTASELLIWSVYRYAASNLKTHFQIDNVTTGTIGGTSATNRASFDMKGLSYYPISITNANVTVQYADVKFYNDDIETKELGNEEVSRNKSTRGTSASHSQHYTMHCGLFLNFTADLKNATDYANRTMTVNGVTFAGTVGVVNGGSGALVCGRVAGETREGNTSICTVVLADGDEADKAVSLNGLSVAPAGDYTPALINTIGSYAGLKANYVTATAPQTGKTGSSLIGNVGGQGATGVSIAFAGTIKLPEIGVFSKATLLNSLRYNSGSATYNFYKSKDYTGDTCVHNATHGKELSTTVEYAGKQGCYYDGYEAGNFVSANSSFDSQNDFSTYLPYVAFSPATGDTTHTLASGWHEIAVNVLSDHITDGCGTYGHPYKVTGNLLKQVADYINTGTASDGWQVRISSDNEYHTTKEGHDVLLTYSEGGWKNGKNPYKDKDVRQYLQSAYYLITEDVELANFSGIGTSPDWAFTGVIKGQQQGNGKWPTVTLSGGSTAFIQYSYGSVVCDLNIVLNQSPTLTRPTRARGTAEQAPSTFFGGVIGCVLGGDNIIENVGVSTGDGFLAEPSGSKSHLVPVGGYVGAIAGGGVIFRGTISSNTGITGTGEQLYRNPIIGRVLGGYAFYEGTGTAPSNTDQNYTINKITPPTTQNKDLSWDGTTKELTVNNAQGLLILSAIVSSGAGSTQSNAYKNGVARNAAYDQIGAESQPDDYAVAQKDSGKVWENSQTPYLLSKYAGYTGSNSICDTATTGIDVKFAENATFNMTGYGNGYRGLSARYVSNAAFTESGVDASAVVMRVKTFNGQNATVQNINMDVKEYNDDDFHMASMGGIFNIVWTAEKSGGTKDSVFAQKLTLKDCNVQLKYFNISGTEVNAVDGDTLSDADGRYSVSVGGFIGMANDINATQGSVKHNYLFTGIRIEGTSDKKCKIYGPNGVGGLIGTTAMTSTAITGYPGKLLADGKWSLFGPSFLNCSYSNVEVTGGMAAGGLIGDAYASGSTTVPGFSGLGISYGNKAFLCYASCTVTDDNLTVGAASTITARAKGSIAAGIFGAAGMRVGVNDPGVAVEDKTNLNITGTFQTLKLSNVDILVSQENYNGSNPDSGENNAYAGGIIARIGSENPVCFYDVDIQGGRISSKLATNSIVGGIVGSGYTNQTNTMQRCHLSNITVTGVYAGGFLGQGKDVNSKGSPIFQLHMSDCSIIDSTIGSNSTDAGYQKTSYAGGLVGNAAREYYLSNVLIKNTSIVGTKNGRLFGNASNMTVYAAGISVYADPSSTCTIPTADIGNGSITTGYIAYADYTGMQTNEAGGNDPYVTVNPNFTLTTGKTLYGDAVGKITDDSYNSVAARVWADSKTGATGKKNLAAYAKASAIVNATGKTEPLVSTFREVQGYKKSGEVATGEPADWRLEKDLPVLVLKGNDASAIEDYLNVITNGGYDEANVTPTVSVYYFVKDKQTFSAETEEQKNTNPASVYYENNQFHIRSRTFDNTLDRFSLVEASFAVTVNGEVRTYTVSLPVVVIRELQFDYMATFSYGKEFYKETYKDLKTHLLESTGNPFTAYLTYQYNREKGQYVEYDWQTYMDDGGSMLNVDKVLSFSSGLPAGTQMVLLDCQNGNQAYQYTTSGENTNDVQLSDFTSLGDGKTKFQSSMADILGVTKSGPLESGKFVQTTAEDGTVRMEGEYYRLYHSDTDSDKDRYNLIVSNLSSKAPEENYYLVITVPNQNNPDYYINGSLSSTLNWSMPSSGTQMHRYDPTKVDDRNNTESTYQISTGYRQTLVSTAVSGEAINLGDSNKIMQVKVQDTITFSNGQTYGDSDKLFLKLTVNLQECTTSGDKTTSEEKQIPVGTTGTVKFYVHNQTDDTYYTWNGTAWISQQISEASPKPPVAVTYDWSSQGGNMELLLSADGTNALDLSAVRQAIKGTKSEGDSQIIVTAEMDVKFGSSEVLNAAVPASDRNGTDTWARLHYLGQISTQETSLNYSAMRATVDDNAKYYRGVSYQAVLSMDAATIDQLGVNPLQLVPDYQETINGKNASRIDLTAALNLANLQNIEKILQSTNSITFTLSLQRRKDDIYVDVANASYFIAFDTGWSWTIPQDQYYRDGKIVTEGIFDGTQFTFPITAYVFTDQKDFANYKIKLSVSFEDSTVSVNDTDAYVVYTYACIKPSFYEPQESDAQNSTPPAA